MGCGTLRAIHRNHSRFEIRKKKILWILKISRFQRKKFFFAKKNATFFSITYRLKKNYENAPSRCRKPAPPGRTDARTHGQRQLRAPTVTTNSLRSRSSIARFASEKNYTFSFFFENRYRSIDISIIRKTTEYSMWHINYISL